MSEAAAMDQEDDLALTSLPSAGIYTYSQASACRGYQSCNSVVTSSLGSSSGGCTKTEEIKDGKGLVTATNPQPARRENQVVIVTG